MKHSKKLLSLLLTATMAVSLIPSTVMADKVSAQENRAAIVTTLATDGDTSVFDTVEEAGAYVADKMAARVEEFSVTLNYPADHPDLHSMSGDELSAYVQSFYKPILDAAYTHTGVPDRGDYLRWHVLSNGASLSATYSKVTYEFHMKYYTTAEQEQQVAETIDSVLASLNLDGKTDYQKFTAIYDYVTKHCTYDYTNLNDENYTLKYSAYAALIDQTAVCQGYANLIYRMLLTVGVDTRLIAGLGNGEAHGWNIVKLGNKYYNVGSTWDSKDAPITYNGTQIERHYLMKYRLRAESTKDFPNHVRYTEYTTAEFNEQYPMSTEDYPAPMILGYAVELSDSIGVKCMVNIPEGVDKDTVYVTFKLSNGRRHKVTFAECTESAFGAPTYCFVLELNAMEIADTFTATLHYGTDGETSESVYSCQEYCEYIKNTDGYGENVVALVKAMEDYGYYLQNSGWTDNNTHEEAIKNSDYSSDDISRVQTLVAPFAFVSPVGKNNIVSAAYSVSMNSRTKIYYYVKLADNHYYPDNSVFKRTDDLGEGNWYVYVVEGLGPRSFASMHVIQQGEVSVLSYVNAVLKNTSGTFTTGKQYAMVAMYDYYQAVMNYINTPKPTT